MGVVTRLGLPGLAKEAAIQLPDSFGLNKVHIWSNRITGRGVPDPGCAVYLTQGDAPIHAPACPAITAAARRRAALCGFPASLPGPEKEWLLAYIGCQARRRDHRYYSRQRPADHQGFPNNGAWVPIAVKDEATAQDEAKLCTRRWD